MSINTFNLGWGNAIEYEDANPNQHRMCYLCKGVMNHGTRWDSDATPYGGVNVDHVNGNKRDNRPENLVAVHYECNVEKGNQDGTELYLQLLNKKWWKN